MDGRDKYGEKHHRCILFVLDIDHDPHAIPALIAYANSCAIDYPQLAAELSELAMVFERKNNENSHTNTKSD